MREYLESLSKINDRIKQLQSLDTTSSELNITAEELDNNIQLYIEEIKKMLVNIKELIEPSLMIINQAEKIWESKLLICQISPLDIVEELGKLIGKKEVIKTINDYQKENIIKTIVNDWRKECLVIKNKYFAWDNVNEKYKNEQINAFLKEEIFNQILLSLQQIEQKIQELIKIRLLEVYEEIIIFINDLFNTCIQSLEKNLNKDLKSEVEALINNLKFNSENPTVFLPEKYQDNISFILGSSFNKLHHKTNNDITNFFRLSLEDFDKFMEETAEIIRILIIDIMEQKTNLFLIRIEDLINFYNNFLEKQNSYQEELSFQHDLEKIWIQQQKTELNMIIDHINILLD